MSIQLAQLNLPTFSFRMKEEQGKQKIFDQLRRKWLVLTPEEWVRQNIIAFLIEQKEFPPIRIANEIALQYNGLSRRCDSLVYDQHCKPLLIIEYKAPSIAINQKVFDQIAVYNLELQVPYLLVSNGLQHIFCQVNLKERRYLFIPEIPNYQQLIAEKP